MHSIQPCSNKIDPAEMPTTSRKRAGTLRTDILLTRKARATIADRFRAIKRLFRFVSLPAPGLTASGVEGIRRRLLLAHIRTWTAFPRYSHHVLHRFPAFSRTALGGYVASPDAHSHRWSRQHGDADPERTAAHPACGHAARVAVAPAAEQHRSVVAEDRRNPERNPEIGWLTAGSLVQLAGIPESGAGGGGLLHWQPVRRKSALTSWKSRKVWQNG